MNPTINIQVKDVRVMPVRNKEQTDIEVDAKTIMSLSKLDWDTLEISIGFLRHPMVDVSSGSTLIAEAYEKWEQECNKRFFLLKEKEEAINRVFIDAYGLSGELKPEVDEKDISIRLAEKQNDIKSLVSYAVGCMFGRYSIDVDGLVYAGGTWDEGKYTSFIPDDDNVIPITDEDYLEDDIVSRFCEWLKVVYGADTLEENLDFIAKALGNKGDTSRTIIRNYFLTDFFKDHCQTYSVAGSGKRPMSSLKIKDIYLNSMNFCPFYQSIQYIHLKMMQMLK